MLQINDLDIIINDFRMKRYYQSTLIYSIYFIYFCLLNRGLSQNTSKCMWLNIYLFKTLG